LQKIKVVFMGTPSYATTILKTLLKDDDIEVQALFTQADKPVGRKKILTPPDTKKYLLEEELNIPVYQPKTLKDDESKNILQELSPDFIVVAAYGQILPKSILDIAPCINLHASLLPKYRGASPIQEAIKNQDRLSGVTAMLMDEGLDTGDILGFGFLNIDGLHAPKLFEELSILAADITPYVLKNFHKIKPVKQNALLSSHCKKITKADGEVQLLDAKEVFATYLAYFYWPNIFLKSGLKLKKIDLNDSESTNHEGEILEICDDHIIVGCQKGSLKIYDVQPPSKKQMSVLDYLRGKRLAVGDTLL